MVFRSIWRALVLVLVLIGCGVILPAQEYNFGVYRQSRGLDNLAVSGLVFDRDGFLWVGTENGLYRFLGDRFQRFGAAQGIEEREIQDIYTAPDGTLWAGTYQNLYRWTGSRFEQAGPRPIAIWNSQHLAAEAPGKLLVVDKNRLFRLTYGPQGKPLAYDAVLPGAIASAIPATRHLTALFADAKPSGAIWMGCEYGLCAWKDGKLTQFGAAQGIPKELWYSILRDLEGNLWIVSEHHVMERMRGADRFLERTPPGGDPNSVFRRTPIVLDSLGRVVVAAQQGLARWNGSGWTFVDQANGLRTSYLTAVRFDAKNGDAWMGSNGQGLYHWIGYNDWEGWTDRQGMPSSIVWSAGLFRDGQIYVGTEKGPARVDLKSGKAEKLFLETKWRYGQVSGMTPYDKDQILAGTFSGALLRIRTQTRAVTQLERIPGLIYTLIRDPSGRIFVPTDQGLFVIDAPSSPNLSRGNPKARPVPEVTSAFAGKPPSIYNGCFSPSGALWFVTDYRIFGFQHGQWQFPTISGFPKAMRALNDLACAADGSLWVTGQQSGNWHLQWQSGHWNATELSLPAEYNELEPLAILSDRRGWLWIGTDDGVLVFDGQANGEKSWRHLNQESGLIWNDINGSRMSIGPDGSLWFGTSGGLGHLIHPERVFAPVQLNVAITQASRGSQVLPATDGFTLPWSNQSLDFQFAAPVALNRSDLKFDYRIPQLDTEWTTTRNSTVQFPSLPSGNYDFELVASNTARAATSATVTASFRILPPWWRTYWFYSVGVLALLAILWLFYFLRTRRLLSMKRLLEAQVRERTIELEASREEMRVQATHDSLTGLLNRGAIFAVLHSEMERCFRERTNLVVVLADIDYFKQVNDSWGHLAGDAVLRQFALALRESIRAYDSVGRYGGEEFLLILPGIAAAQVEERLRQLHRAVSGTHTSCASEDILISCSMGAVFLSPQECSPAPNSQDVALAAADLALYKAKETGRNRVILHSESNPDRWPQPVI